MGHTTNSTCNAQTLDAVFDLFRNQRRRYALLALSERESPVPVDELAAAVAGRDDKPAETTDEIASELHHVHLPKLAAANVVEYDDETSEVTLARTENVAPFLDVADGAR